MSSLIVGRTVSVLGPSDLTLNYAVNETTHDPAFFISWKAAMKCGLAGNRGVL